MFSKLVILLLFSLSLLWPLSSAYAIYDPLSVPNNKFGIHIITLTPDEASPAAQLVNSTGGDWGYITVLAESSHRDTQKWQTFFDDLRRRHLIPLVRLATQPENDHWKRPYDGEEQAWADFLDSLVWPTKNRYIIIYNEPNQGQEWAGTVDAADYAHTLDKTITALKAKNPDFFVLNAGFDASAPEKLPAYEDELQFLKEMNQTVPGIFNKLDGWVSHSYPNPGFVGSPYDNGRGTVRTYAWELQVLNSLGVNKDLPVFITETGWKHAEGINYDKSLPQSDTVAQYYQEAFSNAWNNNRIVAVTPFLLSYQEAPFDHFSFKHLTGEPQNEKILGVATPDYYSPYQTIMAMNKTAGKPIQDNRAKLVEGTIYISLVSGQSYSLPLTFKNTGQSIWNDQSPINLKVISGQKEFSAEVINNSQGQKVEPGQQTTFTVNLKAPTSGTYKLSMKLYLGDQPVEADPLEYTIDIKSPVNLLVESALKWDKSPQGEYKLNITSKNFQQMLDITLDPQGRSSEMEERYLLPDQEFDFTLQKPFYQSKTIHMKVESGSNELNFGELEPDIFSALLHPITLWEMLPISGH